MKMRDLIDIVESAQRVDEGVADTIAGLAKKLPGFSQYYQLAQQYKPQLVQILKTSKSGEEVKKKMEELVAQAPVSVAEAGIMKQLGGAAAAAGSVLSVMWMNYMGMIDGLFQRAAGGEMGGAIAAGAYLAVIPVGLMILATMLLFKGSKEQNDAKRKADLQKQQGMTEQELDELTRRDFLRGVGAAAGGAALASMAGSAGARVPLKGGEVDPDYRPRPIEVKVDKFESDGAGGGVMTIGGKRYPFKQLRLSDPVPEGQRILLLPTDFGSKGMFPVIGVYSGGVVYCCDRSANESSQHKEMEEAATPDAIQRIQELVKYK